MIHRAIGILSMLIVSSLLFSCETAMSEEQLTAMSEEELTAKAKGIHENLLTIDTHDDIPLIFASEEVDPGVRGDRQVDLPKMIEGGLDAGFFIVFVGQTERTPENYAKAKEDAMTKFNAIQREANRYKAN